MKGDGNGLLTLLQKLYFSLLPTAAMRSNYIIRHKDLFKHIGFPIHWQPRMFPTDPEYISIGNNVRIASGVTFINHDAVHALITDSKKYDFIAKPYVGCINIGDNVLIGANAIIMPNVNIGSNVIIAAGAIVSKDIPDNSVCGGIPAAVICSFDKIIEKRKNLNVSSLNTIDEVWADFYKTHY